MATENLTLAQFFGTQRNPYNYAKVEQIDRDIVTSWLTLDEITNQINNWDDESQDGYLSSLEVAVRMAIEDYLGLSIFPVTFKVYYPNLGVQSTAVYLDLPEVSTGYKGASAVSIKAVEYYSNTGSIVPVALPATQYFYDPTGNRVVVNSIPTVLSQTVANPIVVTYVVNANFAAQYPVVKQAGLLLFTHLYNNRSNTTEGVLHEIPFGIAQLLRPYKPLVM